MHTTQERVLILGRNADLRRACGALCSLQRPLVITSNRQSLENRSAFTHWR